MIDNPIPFLANIAMVAHADGTLSSNELGQLEAIRKEHKFKKSDYNAAVRLVQDGGFRLTRVGTFADQAKNLEYILRVAYSDDDLDDSERKLIDEFCDICGLNTEQLERLSAEVLASLNHEGRVCPSCGTENDTDALFCSKCGNSLESMEQDVQLEFEIPNSGLAVEFADSTAAAFPKALQIAKETEGYQSCQKGKKTWHLAVYPSGELAEALPLAECLSGIRNRGVYINGEEKPWDEVFGFAWCAAERTKAYRPIEYCFGKDENRLNPWGCKQARMDWSDWSDWFCYGQWEKSGMIAKKVQWRFDKKRIQHEVATNLYRYRFCPHLNTDLAKAVIRLLPETVSPDSDPNWDYHQSYEQVPGAIKVVQRQRSSGFTYTDEFWADGVRPKGLQVLADILTKAFNEIQAPCPSMQALLK